MNSLFWTQWRKWRAFLLSLPLALILATIFCERFFFIIQNQDSFLRLPQLLVVLYLSILVMWLELLWHLSQRQNSAYFLLILPVLLIGGSLFFILNIEKIEVWIGLITLFMSLGYQYLVSRIEHLRDYLIGQQKLTVTERTMVVQVLVKVIFMLVLIFFLMLIVLVWILK